MQDNENNVEGMDSLGFHHYEPPSATSVRAEGGQPGAPVSRRTGSRRTTPPGQVPSRRRGAAQKAARQEAGVAVEAKAAAQRAASLEEDLAIEAGAERAAQAAGRLGDALAPLGDTGREDAAPPVHIRRPAMAQASLPDQRPLTDGEQAFVREMVSALHARQIPFFVGRLAVLLGPSCVDALCALTGQPKEGVLHAMGLGASDRSLSAASARARSNKSDERARLVRWEMLDIITGGLRIPKKERWTFPVDRTAAELREAMAERGFNLTLPAIRRLVVELGFHMRVVSPT